MLFHQIRIRLDVVLPFEAGRIAMQDIIKPLHDARNIQKGVGNGVKPVIASFYREIFALSRLAAASRTDFCASRASSWAISAPAFTSCPLTIASVMMSPDAFGFRST